MAGWIWADTVTKGDGTKVPTFSGKGLRLLSSALVSKRGGRPLGGRSGVTAGTVGTDVLSVTSAAYTVQPLTGYIDVSAASDGGTPFATDLTTAALNSPDSTNQRIDLLYIRHDDPAETSDGSTPGAVIGYLAGNPATGVLPSTPARAIPLARIVVPKLNNGAPTITLIAPFTVAAGGIVPARNTTEYPPTPFVGQVIDDATLGLQRWNGTNWESVPRCQMGTTAFPTGGMAPGSFASQVLNLDPAIFGGNPPSNVQITGKDPFASWCQYSVETTGPNQAQLTATNVNNAALPTGRNVAVYWIAYR